MFRRQVLILKSWFFLVDLRVVLLRDILTVRSELSENREDRGLASPQAH